MVRKTVRIVSILALLMMCFAFASCNADIGTAQGKDAVPLSAPTNVRVDGTTLKWNFVENAVGYTVKIVSGAGADINNATGEEIPLDGRDTTSYSLAHLTSGDYTIGVKARGDSVVYSSSAYSAIQYNRKVDIGDNYGDGSVSRPFGEFDDVNTKNSFLGYGINIIDASSIASKNVLMTYPIFDMDKLQNVNLLYSNDHYNSFESLEGETIEAFVKSMESSTSLSSGSSVSAKGNVFGANLGASVSLSNGISSGFTKTSSEVQSQYFLEIIAENQSYWLILQSSEDRYKEMLSEEFKKDLYSDMEPARLFEKYGTHLLTSVAMGGSISMYYTLYSYAESVSSSQFAEVSRAIKTEVSAAYGGYSGSVGSESSFESSFKYSTMASSYGILIDERIFCAGGGSYGINNAQTLYDNYYDWQNSLDIYPVVIGIKDSNSLYGIWDLLDMNVEGAAERYAELYSYFVEYGVESYNALCEAYDITPAVIPTDITNIRLNGDEYTEGNYHQVKSGDSIKIEFDPIPDNSNKYQKTYSVYSDHDTDTFKAATVDSNGVISISPEADSGTYITVIISAGTATKQITLYVINSYIVNFNTGVAGLEVAPVYGILEGYMIDEPRGISREGYTFDGWYVDSAKTERFDFGSDCIYANTTLYAKWTEIKPVVTFNTHGGSEIASVTVAYKDPVTAPKAPTRSGYTFAGWYTDDECTAEYNFNTELISNIDLYAKWNRIDYTVSFVTNGGTPVAPITTSIETDYKISEPVTERALYDFKGWYTDEGCTQLFYFGSEITSDITLYAKWDVHYFTVSYFVDGEAYGSVQSYTYGETVNYLAWPVMDGKEFSGWTWTGGTLPETMPAQDMVIEGSFDQVLFTVKYYVDGALTDTVNVYKGHTIPANEKSRVGYTFSGWQMKTDDGFASVPSEMPAYDIELHGTFAVNQYTITFDPNGGSEVAPITLNYGAAVTAPADPTRTGHIFAGWDGEIPSTMPAENITLTAAWDADSYFINYDMNSQGLKGTFSTNENVSRVTYGVTSVINIANISYSKYYSFDGWYTASSGGQKVAESKGQLVKSVSGYTDSDGKWIYVGDITLYAHYTQTYSGYTYIDTAAEFNNIALTGNYLLLCDLDMGGAKWEPKGTFKGVLNGDGHSIYHFYIDKSGSGSVNIGLFATNEGEIRDLTIGMAGVKKYDSTYSVKYNVNYSETSSQLTVYVGGFAARNKGTIANCKLVNTYINVLCPGKNNNETTFLDVGGISAGNNGTIENCSIESSKIYAKADVTGNDGDNTRVWVGGICAANWGTIKSCTAKNSSLTSNAKGDGTLTNKAYPFSCVGGIVGEQANGVTTACSSSGCSISAEASKGGNTEPTKKSGAIYGVISGGSVI